MHKIFFLFLFALGLAHGASGQFSAGLIGGINFSNVDFGNIDVSSLFESKVKTSFFLGVVTKYQLNEKLTVISDIQISQKGYRVENISVSNDSKFRNVYLDILPEISYQVHDNIGIGIGMNIGVELSEGQKLGSANWMSTKAVDFFNSPDFGVFGTIRFSRNELFLLVRYNLGLSNIANFSYTDVNGNLIGDGKQINRNFQIGMGYFLWK